MRKGIRAEKNEKDDAGYYLKVSKFRTGKAYVVYEPPPRSHLVHHASLSGTKSIQILDHAVVKVAEEEYFAIGAETEGGIIGFEAGLGLVNDEAYAGESFPSALLYAIKHQEVAYAVSRTGIFISLSPELGKDCHAVEVELTRVTFRFRERKSFVGIFIVNGFRRSIGGRGIGFRHDSRRTILWQGGTVEDGIQQPPGQVTERQVVIS